MRGERNGADEGEICNNNLQFEQRADGNRAHGRMAIATTPRKVNGDRLHRAIQPDIEDRPANSTDEGGLGENASVPRT